MVSTGTATGLRRMAPLSDRNATNHAPKVKGLIFDMDGTLCLPQNYMFQEMRKALDIPRSTDILEHILSLSDDPEGSSGPSPRSRAQGAIKDIERQAMSRQQPQPGLNELITYLAKNDLRIALCTRNFELPVKHLLDNFVSEEGRSHFHPLITREAEGVRAKPSPDGLWACVHAWDTNTEDAVQQREALKKYLDTTSEESKRKSCEGVIMVGDSIDDIEAGARAGAATVLLVNDENRHLLEHKEWPKKVDLSITRLDELIHILDNGFQGRH